MGFFSHGSNNSADEENTDFERLRKDLVDEYLTQSVTFSGGLGFMDMNDAETASDEQLLEMARREGFNLKKYRK